MEGSGWNIKEYSNLCGLLQCLSSDLSKAHRRSSMQPARQKVQGNHYQQNYGQDPIIIPASEVRVCVCVLLHVCS